MPVFCLRSFVFRHLLFMTLQPKLNKVLLRIGFLTEVICVPSVAYGRNARLGDGFLPSPFEVLRGFFRMSSLVVVF